MTESSKDDEDEEHTEDGEDKDVIIDRLKQKLLVTEKQLEEAKGDINILNEELYREKMINNKLLGIAPSVVTSPKAFSPHPAGVTQSLSWDHDACNSQSQELVKSPLLTPAQRTHHSSSDLANNFAINSPQSQLLTPAQRSPVVNSQHSSPSSYLENSVSNSQEFEDSHKLTSENSNKSDEDNHYKHVTFEIRRMKRAKGMLFGLKRIPASVNTLLILDSNGRDIVGDQIDDDTGVCSVRAVGGLCMPALCDALDSLVGVNLSFKKIKTLVLGLGANDLLHNETHPEDKSIHIEGLNNAIKTVFPNAIVHYIPPFSAIKAVGQDGVDSLLSSVKSSGVGWKIHQPPSMRGKLAEPELLHIRKKYRNIFIDWLRTRFGPKYPTNHITATNNSPAPPRTHRRREFNVPPRLSPSDDQDRLDSAPQHSSVDGSTANWHLPADGFTSSSKPSTTERFPAPAPCNPTSDGPGINDASRLIGLLVDHLRFAATSNYRPPPWQNYYMG